MIANITKGNGFYGCVAYVLGKDDARLINTNMAGETPAQLAWEFRQFANLNKRTKKPVLHISLSPSPDDRPLDDWEYIQITNDLLDGLNLSNNQFVLVQHNDASFDGKPRPHAHLVINRVDYDGKCNDDYKDFYRIQKIERKIEKDYNLIIQPSSWEVENKKAYPKHTQSIEAGELNIVEKLQQSILTAASDQPEMPTFVARLLKENIEVGCKFTRTGKLKGITYCIDGQWFSGGDLGSQYSHNGIRNKLNVKYIEDYQKTIEELENNYKRGIKIDEDTSSDSDDSTFESIKNNDSKAVIKQNNDYISVIPSPKELFGNPTKNKENKDSVESYKSNTNTNDTIDNNDDSQEVAPPQNNNYISVLPSISELFPAPKEKDKDKKENRNITPPTIEVETQPTVAPEIQAPTSAAEENSTLLINNNEALGYIKLIAAYLRHIKKNEYKGETLHATLNPENRNLTVKRIDSEITILEGDYNTENKQWRLITVGEITPEDKRRITKLEKEITKQPQQPTTKNIDTDMGID